MANIFTEGTNVLAIFPFILKNNFEIFAEQSKNKPMFPHIFIKNFPMCLKSFLTISALLCTMAICGQPPKAVEQVMELLEHSRSNFRDIAGPYDEKKKVWNTSFHLETSTDNWLLLANEYDFCFFQARLIETQKLNQTKDTVKDWVEKLRPKLKDFNETYIQRTKSIFNVKYDQYIFHKLEAGSQFVVKVEAIKSDNENFYKATVTVWRQWGDMIKKY